MPDARTIIDGEPGTYFANEGTTVLYQFSVAGFGTCAVCWQYQGQIARYWPIPIHRNCRCRQSLIKPGQQAPKPFVDYQALVAKLDRPQQAALMGVSNFALWRSGAVKWEQIVTPGRIRSLREVMDLADISIKRAIKAGVAPSIARAAYQATHQPESVYADLHRQQLIDRVLKAGIPHETLLRQLSERLASRSSVAAGPGYTTRTGVVLPGIPAATLMPPEATRRAHAAELGAILAATGASRVAMHAAPALSDRNRAMVAAELGDEAARNVAAFLAAVDERRGRGENVGEEVARLYKRYR